MWRSLLDGWPAPCGEEAARPGQVAAIVPAAPEAAEALVGCGASADAEWA